METWLASIEPRVIDAWLAFAVVEPEAFADGRQRGGGKAGGGTKWVTADKAVEMLAGRFGK